MAGLYSCTTDVPDGWQMGQLTWRVAAGAACLMNDAYWGSWHVVRNWWHLLDCHPSPDIQKRYNSFIVTPQCFPCIYSSHARYRNLPIVHTSNWLTSGVTPLKAERYGENWNSVSEGTFTYSHKEVLRWWLIYQALFQLQQYANKYISSSRFGVQLKMIWLSHDKSAHQQDNYFRHLNAMHDTRNMSPHLAYSYKINRHSK